MCDEMSESDRLKSFQETATCDCLNCQFKQVHAQTHRLQGGT